MVGKRLALIEFDAVYAGAVGAQHVLVHAGRFAAYVLKHENVLLAEATPGGLPGVGHQPVLPLWAAQR